MSVCSALRSVASGTPPRVRPSASYALAALVPCLTAAVQAALVPRPSIAPFVLLYFGVTLVAWLGGVGPGLVAALVSAVLGNYFFIAPFHELTLDGAPLAATLLFVPTAAAIAVLCGSLRTSRLGAEERAAQLRRFELLVEHSREIVLFLRRDDGRILDANRAALEAYGYPREELLGMTVADLRPPDTLGALPRQMQLADEGGAEFEAVHRRKDGSTFPVEVSSRGADISDGRMLISVVRDITERKRAEDELRRSEERLRRLIDVSAQIVWTTGVDGIPVEDSPSWRAFTGRSLEQWLGTRWLEAVHPDDREALWATWERAFVHREPYEAEFRLLDARGSYRDMVSRAAPVLNADGSVREWIGMNTDITERKRSDAAVHESEARFRGVVENMPDAVTVYDERGRVAYVNPAFERISGVSVRDIVGKPCDEVWPVCAVERIAGLLECAYANGERISDEYTARSPSGQMVTRQLVMVPVKGADDLVRQVLVIGHDVTEERRMLDALRENSRRKDEFLAMLSHELRNPLTPIRNSVFILQKAGLSSQQAGRAMAVIDRQSAHLTRMVNDLLDLNRISRHAVQLQRGRVELVALARRTAEDYAAGFAAAGVALEVVAASERLEVEGDEARLVQVLGNLLHNAAKFTEPGGRTTVEIARNRQHAVITVRDTGVGISEETLERLFEPFAQADRSLDRSKGGLGLGLALSKSIVELHGGELTARSDGPGHGATFVVKLPLAHAHAATGVPRSDQPRQ